MTITIKNIGSIKEATLPVKSVNVFMGPQATGKSTIAKIISQALWAEKNYLTIGDEFDFYGGLMRFHKMHASYFSKESEIFYQSPWCEITMRYVAGKRHLQTQYSKKKNTELYHNVKVEYIPAERNFVSSIENIQRYSENYNSTIGFLNDWHTAKSQYQRSRHFDIDLPDLSFSYRYISSQDSDIIKTDNHKEIELHTASSGQQSVLPMLLVADNVMRGVYHTQKIFSPAERQHIKMKAPNLAPIIDVLSTMGKKARTKEFEAQLKELWNRIGYVADYGCTHLVVEEPEQNLYPSTQRGLTQLLIRYIVEDTLRNHTLTLTTHSPYILYALNNCMLAGKLVADGKQQTIEAIGAKGAINPSDVGLWLLRNGEVVPLQDKDTHLLNGDMFNDEFQKNHAEMYQLLKLMREA